MNKRVGLVAGVVMAAALAGAPGVVVAQVPGNARVAALEAVGSEIERGEKIRLPLVITNPTAAPLEVEIEFQVQRDGRLAMFSLPDTRHGMDHAAGAESWTEVNGERIETGSLTDLKPGTAARATGKDLTEAMQYVDLGQARRITRLTYQSGDANQAWRVDVSASMDGETWNEVAGLKGVDMQKKWGHQVLPVEQPFEARYLRLRHHKDGETVNTLAMPSRLSVYDGVADETWALPQVGEVVSQASVRRQVGAEASETIVLESDDAFTSGSYLAAVRVRSGEHNEMLTHNVFVMPEPLPDGELEARVGLNSSQMDYAPMHQKLGIGWVRFENLKWRMTSPRPGFYQFDGLPPWSVNHDLYLKTMQAHGIDVLPYFFLSPEWASSAPKDAKHRAAYPPTDFADYGDFCFQAVARYGSRKHEPETLKTEDKVSGLGLLKVVELWNEPNLNDPGWGHFVGPIEQYYEMFRVGAEAVKRADPEMKVANAGYAGIRLEIVDQLRSYEYADGKRPLDFVDVLSVHTYTGATPPELAVVDTNVDRGANAEGSVSQEEHLKRLVDWRNIHRPGMPIWMTETGFDTGGPRAVSERDQAALNVRNTLLMLGTGIDAVQIYREAGSGNGLYAASGLHRDDRSLKPSWHAMATLIRQLHKGGEITRLPHADSEVYLWAWQRGGEDVIAAWSVGAEKPLGVELGKVTVTDAFGGQTSIERSGELVLSDMPVYLSGISDAAAVRRLVDEGEAQWKQWQAARRKLADTRAYLFDFGSVEHVAVADIGGPRKFTPVLAAETFEAGRGYGFEPKAADRNNTAGWIRDLAQKDSCRLTPGMSFRAAVEPGRYEVTVFFSTTGGEQEMVVESGGKSQALKFTRDQKQQSVTLDAAKDVQFKVSGYGDLSWISLVAE